MNLYEKQQPTNPDWGQHPRAPPSYYEVTGDQFNQGQAQPYHSQPVIMQQPVMSQPPVVMPVTVQMGQVPVPPGYCTNCRSGIIRKEFTCCGVLWAICCFPIGILCCLMCMERRCQNCRVTFN